YSYWSQSITDSLAEELGKDGSIINLASNEYFKVIDKKLEDKVLHIEFRENKPEGLKVIPILSKRARGLMARFAVKNKIVNVDDLKLFDYENYMFYEPLSTSNKWVFIRRT
ncbi:MAG TPA: peroxide stress protein YaaA, partial [Tenuifilaceae bacterium]|nr:peroxide stress protein YaaA [Tenuifilaceae bacterium]